jgi:hypothetical protein
MSDFLHILFRTFSSLLGGMGASIALLNKEDSFSCVFTPVVFHFYMHSAYDWKDWGKVADSHDVAEKAIY